ncbi:MAG: sigma-70 family RNA polymerase sigma factor [Nanoarchaeota archaeon]
MPIASTQSASKKIELLTNKLHSAEGRKFFDAFTYRINIRYGLSYEDAEDIWQDVLLKFMSDDSYGNSTIDVQLPIINDEGLAHDHSVSTLMKSCLYNKAIDYVRKKEKQKRTTELMKAETMHQQRNYRCGSATPLDELIRKEKEQVVREEVVNLREDYQKVCRSRYWDEKSFEEIASEENCPTATCRIRFFRAKNILKTVLAAYFG